MLICQQNQEVKDIPQLRAEIKLIDMESLKNDDISDQKMKEMVGPMQQICSLQMFCC